jgi:hypothetical protein
VNGSRVTRLVDLRAPAAATASGAVASTRQISGDEPVVDVRPVEAVVPMAAEPSGSSTSTDWAAVRALTLFLATRTRARTAVNQRIIEDLSLVHASPAQQR